MVDYQSGGVRENRTGHAGKEGQRYVETHLLKYKWKYSYINRFFLQRLAKFYCFFYTASCFNRARATGLGPLRGPRSAWGLSLAQRCCPRSATCSMSCASSSRLCGETIFRFHMGVCGAAAADLMAAVAALSRERRKLPFRTTRFAASRSFLGGRGGVLARLFAGQSSFCFGQPRPIGMDCECEESRTATTLT
jgi:hypothetical protein